MKKPITPMQRVMYATFGAGTVGCALTALLYHATGIPWLEPLAITCGMTAYHMLIRFLSPLLLNLLFPAGFDSRARWFRPRKWEPAMYSLIRVQRWKVNMPSWNPEEFSLEKHSLEEIVRNMCRAEVVHELIMLLSFTSVFFIIPFGAPAAFLITAVLAALFDSLFVILQRYNRPRMMMILDRRRERARAGAAGKEAAGRNGASA